jgi:hypothetical protein
MDFDSYARRLWAGRADAYEHGFARLTAHAWIDAVWDMGQGANTFPVGVTRPDPGHDPVRTCASCPGREWSTSAFLSWGHCPQADQEAT